MRLIWTPAARRQLQEIIEYIAQDSVERAISYGRQIEKRAGLLKKFPGMGRYVPEFLDEFPELREILIGDYRLIYLVHGHQISILILFHGHRRKLLLP